MNPDRAAAVGRLAEMIVALERAHPVRVALDGVDGSGKTTLGDDLGRALRARGRPCVRASGDGFHRPPDERYRQGRRSPDGYFEDAFDFETMRRVLLGPLGPGGDRRYRTAIYDVGAERDVEQVPRRAERRVVLVVDGVFLQRPGLDREWDFRVWVETTLETARARAVARDRGTFGPEIDRRYRERYMPAQRRYLEEVRPDERADVRFVNNDPDHPVLVTRAP